MAGIDGTVYLVHLFLFTTFYGEYICQTRGEGHIARRWSDTGLASVTENGLQMLLSFQVLYSMLRLCNHMDALYECFVIFDLLFILLLMLTRQVRDGYGQLPLLDWIVMFFLETWDVANSLVITIILAHEKEHEWPSWVADAYVLQKSLTLSGQGRRRSVCVWLANTSRATGRQPLPHSRVHLPNATR